MSHCSDVRGEYPYVSPDTDRRGNVRYYFRRPGQGKIRIPGEPGSPEFVAAYALARSGELKSAGGKPKAGTMAALVTDYKRSAEWKKLSDRTRYVRGRILDRLCTAMGDRPVAHLKAADVRRWRNDLADRPEAANAIIKALRQVLKHAMEMDRLTVNVALNVKYLAGSPDGFAAWTIEDIQAYEAKHPVGTKARLALALALYTLQRKSDIILFGKQHVRSVTGGDGATQKRLRFRQHKNRNSKPVDIDIPILKELDDIISASPCGELTFLVTQFGQPFTANGFDNRFRKWAREAGVEKSMHGLRKAGGALLADKGCTTQEIMAVGGWLTMKEVERYTRSATRRTLATSAMQKVGQCAS